jgi:methyltransferase
MSAQWAVLVVIAWSCLRVAEYVLSESDMGALLDRGGVERCTRQHLPLLLVNAVVPTLAMTSIWLHVRAEGRDVDLGTASVVALVLLVVAESLHWWAILTLGRRWTTGVVVVPGEQPVVSGPYRWLRHPGYAGGGTSGALLPLVAGSWVLALVAAAFLAGIVVVRIRCEDEAWRQVGAAGPTAAAQSES